MTKKINRVCGIGAELVNPVLSAYLPKGSHSKYYAYYEDGSVKEISHSLYEELDAELETAADFAYGRIIPGYKPENQRVVYYR